MAVTVPDRFYREVFEKASDAIFIVAPVDQTIIAANPSACGLFGFVQQEPIAIDPAAVASVKRILSEPGMGAFETEHVRQDGTAARLEIDRSEVEFDGRTAILIVCRDVTRRQYHEANSQNLAKAALAEREAYYRSLIGNSLDIINIFDGNGVVKFASPSVKEVLGYAPEEVTGGTVFDRIHPADLPGVLAVFGEVLQAPEKVQVIEYRTRHADGSWRAMEAIGHNLIPNSLINGVVVHSRDISDRRKAEAALRHSEERMRLAQQAGAIGTWEFDLQNETSSCCEQNLKLLGCPGSPPSGMLDEWASVLHPEHRERVLQSFRHAAATRSPYYDEFKVVWSDGSVHWLASRGEVVNSEGDSHTRIIGVSIDITARKIAEEEIARARDAALQASNLKSQFLASVSHEIRTPMNGIIGMAGLLLDSDVTPEQQADLETIRTSANYLLDLINDLLDLSRIEAGKLVLETSPFHLPQCLTSVIDLLQPEAARKQLAVDFHYPAGAPQIFIGNGGRLRQIVLNYMGNAVKFTESGSVSLSVSLIERQLGSSQVRISVRDTGPGIDPAVQERLFRKFVQADTASTRRHGGTGLGLAISKSLAGLMGGVVGVSSEPGRGSEFWLELTLPVAREIPPENSTPALEAEVPATIPEGRGRGYRILVAEDNMVNQKVASRLLQKRGARVDLAGNGKEAVELFRSLPYDLVLMDCQMPELDGFDASSLIRQMEAGNRRVPIIAVTAHAGLEEREHCIRSGMDDVLTKPFQLHELDAVLRRYLNCDGSV